jgi:hypothetical protein
LSSLGERCLDLMICWRVLLLCELRTPALQRFLGPAALDLYHKSQSQGLEIGLWPGVPLLHRSSS